MEGKIFTNELGDIKVANDVIAIIANNATTEVEGAGMIGGFTGGITEKLGRKSQVKGIKISGDEELIIDVSINVKYSMIIPEVSAKIQQSVKKKVEFLTGLEVSSVNVYVQNIDLSDLDLNSKDK